MIHFIAHFSFSLVQLTSPRRNCYYMMIESECLCVCKFRQFVSLLLLRRIHNV